jgi:Leucine-rich repeat (LRR) protein
MVLVLILGGWLGWIVHRARVQREVVAAIRQAGGRVFYDDVWYDESEVVLNTAGTALAAAKRKNWPPPWIVDSIGIDYFNSVDTVWFNKAGADEVAGHVARLPGLDFLDLDCSDLSDSGLARLRGLDLHKLDLYRTKVTDNGVQQLRALTNIKELDLSSTSVGDAGMSEVATLPKLERLVVGDTNVTDLGVGSIVKLPALKVLDLSGSRISDKGAALLASKAGLEKVNLEGTRVSPAAIRVLRAAFPDAEIDAPSGSESVPDRP